MNYSLNLLCKAIATVTINLIVAVAIILLNLYVASVGSCQIPRFVLSICFTEVAIYICVEANSRVPHLYRAFGDDLIQIASRIDVVLSRGGCPFSRHFIILFHRTGFQFCIYVSWASSYSAISLLLSRVCSNGGNI